MTTLAMEGALSNATGSASTPRPRYLLDGDGHFRRNWDGTLLLLVLFYGISVPIRVAFSTPESMVLDYIDVISTVLFGIDIILNFFTTFKDDYKVVSDQRVIVSRYLRFWFWLDLAATIPVDAFVSSEKAGALRRFRVRCVS